MSVSRALNRALCRATGYRLKRGWYPDGIEAHVLGIFERVAPYTMTTVLRIDALVRSVEHVVSARVPGDFVECGVWKGGSAMAAAVRFSQLGDQRQLWLYDTFEGMPEPDDIDVNRFGISGRHVYEAHKQKGESWLDASSEEVRENLRSTGYPLDSVRLVKGLVEDTVPSQAPDAISILRLDTDLYSSTAHELKHLVPRVSPGGILIIDDYGSWAGSRKAVDEYFSGNKSVFLQRVDHACRLVVF